MKVHPEPQIENLVARYLELWDRCDIEGLLDMYGPAMRYHDMPSGDIIEHPDLRNFLEQLFRREIHQRIKLKDTLIIENNAAFIHWKQTFDSIESGREVSVGGVELIVFEDGKIRSIREFYEGEGQPAEAGQPDSPGSIDEKMTKLGLSNETADRLVEDLEEYLAERKPWLQPDITLASVSADLGYTRNQISFVINHRLDQTFYELVNSRRIDHAVDRMKDKASDHSVLQIGFDAGFNSVSGFYNAFKKKTGMTPAQYLRKAQA